MSTETFNVLWRDLGCPIAPGKYPYAGKSILVKQVHIDAVAGNPDAVCTVVGGTVLSTGETAYSLSTLILEPC